MVRNIVSYTIVSFIVLALLFSQPVNAIPQRQDPNMVGEEIYLKPEDLEKLLETLQKKLDDEIIKNYEEAIKTAIDSKDYETAMELLRQLRNYLMKNYYNTTTIKQDDDLLRSISIINSISNVTEEGISVNILDLLENYGKILGDKDLLEILSKIKNNPGLLTTEDYNKLAKTLSEITGSSRTDSISKILSQQDTSSMLKKLLTTKRSLGSISNLVVKPNISFPAPAGSINIPPLINPSVQASLPTMTINPVYIIVPVIVLVILYIIYKFKPTYIEATVSNIRKVIARTYVELSNRLKTLNDPVIILYSKIVKYLSMLGFKRYPQETPREYLSKINVPTYRNVLDKITRLYEERVYGGKEVDKALVDRVAEEAREHIGVR